MWHFIMSELDSHVTVFTDKNPSTLGDPDTNGDADSDGEDISAPVKRRRKMLLIDEDDED